MVSCLLIVGDWADGAVLCFGSDGRVDLESAFHGRCDGSAHSQPREKRQISYQVDHVEDRHCEPCVDIPIFISLAKISRASKQLNSAFPATNVIVLANKFNLSAYNSASSAFDAAPYFTPLRTVILLI